MQRFLSGLGFVLLMLGTAGMDSEELLLPIVITFVGVVLIILSDYMDVIFYKEK